MLNVDIKIRVKNGRVMSSPSPQPLSQKARDFLRETVARASEPIPPYWPMPIMVTHTPMHGLEYLPFDQAVRKGQPLLGGNGYLPNEEYRMFYRSGRITGDSLKRALARVGPRGEHPRVITVGSREITADDVWWLHVVFGFEALDPARLARELGPDGVTKRFRQDLPQETRQRMIERTLRECEQCRDHPEEAYLTNLWNVTLAVLGVSGASSGEHPARANLGGSDERRASVDVALPVQGTISDWVDRLAGTTLVEQINDHLIKWLDALAVYWKERPEEYEKRMGYGTHAADPTTQAICRDAWRLFHLAQVLEWSPVEMMDLSQDDVRTLLGWLDAFPPDRHGPVWLEAYEDAFRVEIIQKLSAHRGAVPPLATRPRAQLVLCLDVRSESFRRRVEAQGPYETFGVAGFFGNPLSHQAFDREKRAALCPVLLSPKHAVTDIPRLGEEGALQDYATGTRWSQRGHHVFHDLKHHPVGSMILIDVLGLFFSLGLMGKTLILKVFHAIQSTRQAWSAAPAPTLIAVAAPSGPGNPQWTETKPEGTPAGLAQDFSLAERATFVETGLRVMGLTRNFSRLIVLCGHGSQTGNNPYFAALDCEACGGNHGDANARLFAAMANESEVRRILNEHGLPIPDDTWFLPAQHNATTDRMTFDVPDDLPETHTEDLRVLIEDLEQAGMSRALERGHRIPGMPTGIAPQKARADVEARSRDWANPRPEWGLAGNAAFLIGRRSLTKGLNLGGRVFLHS